MEIKDPAFLFYPQAFSHGTRFMTFEEKGAYIELLCEQADSGHLSLETITKILNSHFSLWECICKKFIQDDKGCFFNEALERHLIKRREYVESRRQSSLKSDEDNVKLYLILDKDSGNIKIGSSVNPQRRFAEMCNQQNPAITIGNRNYELIFVSCLIKRQEEKELHEFFKSKRLVGEWFSLTEDDIKYIKDMYGRTRERTTGRPLNKNTNINENKIKYLDFVYMTQTEFNKLVQRFGEDITNKMIERVNNYVGSKGVKYKSHYHTILNWAARDGILDKMQDSGVDQLRKKFNLKRE